MSLALSGKFYSFCTKSNGWPIKAGLNNEFNDSQQNGVRRLVVCSDKMYRVPGPLLFIVLFVQA